eukprot:5200514-Ditylum_brightwellii.AAC.1
MRCKVSLVLSPHVHPAQLYIDDEGKNDKLDQEFNALSCISRYSDDEASILFTLWQPAWYLRLQGAYI